MHPKGYGYYRTSPMLGNFASVISPARREESYRILKDVTTGPGWQVWVSFSKRRL